MQDTTAPTFVETVPADITVECDAIPTADTLTATDTCGDANVTFNETEVIDTTCANAKIITRVWTATDACDNETVHTQTITVQDTTGPDLTNCVINDTTLECNGDENQTLANTWNADNIEALTSCAVDACNPDAINTVTSNYTFVNLISDCGAGGTIEVTYTVTDECGNESTLNAILTIEDTTAPVLITNLEEESYVICSEIPEPPTLEFSDECSNVDVTLEFNETNNNLGDGEDYEIIWEWTVSDSCNNSNVYTHILNVVSEDFVTDIDGERCNIDGIIDLFEYLTDGIDDSGIWTVEQGDVTVNDDGTFDPVDLELGDYIFNYSMANDDCRATTRVTLNINDKCIVRPCGVEGFNISKAVTPNGDGHNDFFFVQGDQKCGFIIDLQIFNRYGGIIYDVKDYKNDWSGQAIKQSLGQADKLPNGTYYYVIILRNSGLDPITGPLYLGTK